MKILIVDDSIDSILLLQSILKAAGYTDLFTAQSALDAFEQLGMNNPGSASANVDLILMDNVMPEMNGIEASRLIKSVEYLRDIPIIMVTSTTEIKDLQMAFAAGVVDYISKPFKKTEMLARVNSALRLKYEIDRRKTRERELLKVKQQLEEANKELQRLSSLDGLTGVANRRHLDEFLEQEWVRAIRYATPISLILIDVDFFKAYNDNYGHQMGDRCLKQVANSLGGILRHSLDLVARYGGEEFAVVLPNIDIQGAVIVAEKLRLRVEALRITHAHSQVAENITVSLGVSTALPSQSSSPVLLVNAADHALYRAKQEGRNRVEVFMSDLRNAVQVWMKAKGAQTS